MRGKAKKRKNGTGLFSKNGTKNGTGLFSKIRAGNRISVLFSDMSCFLRRQSYNATS